MGSSICDSILFRTSYIWYVSYMGAGYERRQGVVSEEFPSQEP